MIIVPLLAAVAFLGPPATAAGVFHHRLAQLVRPSHAQPVFVWHELSFWRQSAHAPNISRAASRVS